MLSFWKDEVEAAPCGLSSDQPHWRGTVETLKVEVKSPCAVSVGGSGEIFIADCTESCVRRICKDRGKAFPETGTIRGGYDDDPSSQVPLDGLRGLALGKGETRFLADTNNHRICKFEKDGDKLITVAGCTKGRKDGVAKEAQFNRPWAITLARNNSIIVADRDNHQIRIVAPDGQVTTLAGSGKAGTKDGIKQEASFTYPQAVAMGPQDEYVVVANEDGRICRVSMRDGLVSTIASGFSHPSGLLVDCRDHVIVAEYGKHQISVRTAMGVRTVIAGDGRAASKDGEGRAASFHFPRGLAMDPNGDILVADTQVRTVTLPSTLKLRDELAALKTPASSAARPPGCSMTCSTTSLFEWTAVLPITEGLFRGRFELSLEMPFDYPVHGPLIKFLPPLPKHPKVDCKTGRVDVKWDSKGDLLSALKDVHALLTTPLGLVDCRRNTLSSHYQRIGLYTRRGKLLWLINDDSIGDRPDLAIDWREGRLVVNGKKSLELESANHLRQELANLPSSLPAGCSVTSGPNLFHRVAMLHVVKGPFRGGIFELSLQMPFDYPVGSPVIKFVPPITTHPNVDPHTGQVSVEWEPGETSLIQALQQVRALLEESKFDAELKVRNPKAQALRGENRAKFDEAAHKAVRESWRHKLKLSDANELICDLLRATSTPTTTHVSRDSQHELFRQVAEREITQRQDGKKRPNVGDDPFRAQLVLETEKAQVNVELAELTLRLQKTLVGLADLRNPEAAKVEQLEKDLARLFVAEQEGTVNGKGEQGNVNPKEKSWGNVEEKRKTSREGLEELIVQARKESDRLGQTIGTCMRKYALLPTRFERVMQISDDSVMPPPGAAEVADNSGQPLRSDRPRVFIAQAKQLEPKLRSEFRGLVDLFNNRGTNHGNNNHKNDEYPEEEKELREAIASSTLCLSSGVRVQVQFGPGKSLSRIMQKMEKGPPHTVLDYTRATVVFADPLLLALFYECFKKKEKFKVVRVINKFASTFEQIRQQEKDEDERRHKKSRGGGARREEEEDKKEWPLPQPPNVHVNYLFEGHVCEVQLTLEDFFLIKEYSHKPYEILRLDPKEAIEFISAEGVYNPHPGHDCYPC